MIRLFIAIDMPDTIRQQLRFMGSSLPDSRPVPEAQLHLTLKFIGEVESSRLLDIREALEDIQTSAFTIQLRGVGVFPPRSTPKVLWAGITPPKQLIELRNKIERTMHSIGIPREKRKFAPHVTLARLHATPIPRLQDFLAGNALLTSDEFTVDSFTLYSSRLTPRGAQHRVEQCYFLL